MKNYTKFAAICAVCVLTSLSAFSQEAVQPLEKTVAVSEVKTAPESTETVKPKAEETKTIPAKRQSSGNAENWRGFYIGFNVGGTISKSSFSTSVFDCTAGGQGATSTNPTTGVSVITNGCIGGLTDISNRLGNREVKPKGFTGGVQAGYNFQAGNFVAGVETDFNSFRINESVTAQEQPVSTDPRLRVFTNTIKTDWLMTVRPRAGFTVGKALIYGTGGVAVTKLNYESFYRSTNFTLPAAGTAYAIATFQNTNEQTKAGWTAGAGAEFKASDHWSVKGEYLYTQFNASGNTVAGAQGIISTGPAAITPAPNAIVTSNVKLQSHHFRFGVNYRF